MKARIKTKRQQRKELEKEEINRINKLWLYVLSDVCGYEGEKLAEIFLKVNEQAVEVYETPEMWYYIDEKLIDQFKIPFPRENLSERETAVKQIHKEHGRKWRDY